MEFSKLLKQLRQNKGVSIKVLAKGVDLNYTYISKLENSKVNPSSGVIDKFANYFNYDIDELSLAAGKKMEPNPKHDFNVAAFIIRSQSNPSGGIDNG